MSSANPCTKFDIRLSWSSVSNSERQGLPIQKSINVSISSLVGSPLDYASVIWAPLGQTHCSALEEIQASFLKMLLQKYGDYPRYLPEADFGTRLAHLSATSRQEMLHAYGQYPGSTVYSTVKCRKILVSFLCKKLICYLHKIIQGQVDSSSPLERLNFYVPGRPTRDKPLLRPPRANGDFYCRSPFFRMMNLHNELPQVLDVFGMLLAFLKSRQSTP